LLSPETVGHIIEESCEIFKMDLRNLKEITFEANPDDLSVPYLRTLRAIGVNRLSIGIQSLFDPHLQWMNRRHNSARAEDVIREAKESGFENISADLIFGFGLLKEDQWYEEIERIIALGPQHISAYQMGVEPKTLLGREYRKGIYVPPADEISYRQYEYLRKRLSEAGYEHYEISNFALPGYRSEHNSSYWEGVPYLGLGPGAHSYDIKTRRGNLPDIKKYLTVYSDGEDAKVSVTERLTPADRYNEKVMLSLRKTEGLDTDSAELRFSEKSFSTFRNTADRLMADGFLSEEEGKIKIPPEKLFVSDGIIRELFL
jgi:oxygen-independent coproporphyrinogen-3 oxidase